MQFFAEFQAISGLPALFAALPFMAVAAYAFWRSRGLSAQLFQALAENEALRDRSFHLAEQEELYRSLVEEHGDIIVRRDSNHRIVSANDAYLKLVAMLKDAPAAVIGSRFDIRGDVSDVRLATDGQPLQYEQRVETKSGTRWIAFVEAPVRDAESGAIVHQAVGRDVTERRLAEAASEAKSRFLATVSHEIRTPLNGVLGMAQLLKQTGMTPEQSTYVDAITTSGEALLSLIEQILDFSRIEAGKIELVAEPFDLHLVAESVVELLAPKAQDKGIEIALSVSPRVPHAMIGDGNRVRQVLTNLAGNAVKFTESGGVGVSLDMEPDGTCLFEVTDTGIGIAPEHLDHIFEEFEQADGSHARKFEGTGLGLAISKKIVDRLCGSISVESKPGKGSKFSVRITLATDPHAFDLSRSHAPDFSSVNAFIISNAPFEARYLAARLMEAGAEVTVFDSLHRVTAALSRSKRDGVGGAPNVLIADAALGDDSKRLASLAEAAGIKTRIVLLSPFEKHAFGSPSEAGFNGYLTKPVRRRSLFARLADGPASVARRSDALEDGKKAGKKSDLFATEAPTQASRKKSPESWRADVGQRLAGIRVLLAEDNEINALLTERLLTRSGAEVVLTRDGVAALQTFEDTLTGQNPDFDLVMLDMRMPGLDGLETVRRMRTAEIECRASKHLIIALTANAFIEDRFACLAAGFDIFLTKPLNLDRLHEIVDGHAMAANQRRAG